jgi:hypothetical protein
MKRALWGVCLVAFCGLAALGQAAPRSTIRVRLWTLWRDKQAAVTPIAGATLRLCETCRALPLRSIEVRAKDAGLTWVDAAVTRSPRMASRWRWLIR